jgi:two-component system phosphate regulon sensor histidine kinase PhoR
VESSLSEEAQLIYNILPENTDNSSDTFQEFSSKVLSGLKTRITLVALNGTVLGDSDEDYNAMDSHADRPEIIDALEGKYGSSIRYSETLKQYMLYITLPPGPKNIVVRASLSVDHIREKFFSTVRDIIIFSIVILAIAIAISIYTANMFTSIIRSLQEISEHYSKGDFSKKLVENGPKEVLRLKISINSMGEQLQEILNEVSVQKNELQAMLNSMVDSVILFNNKLEVIEMNPAAEQLLKTTFSKIRNEKINIIVKNEEICNLVEKSNTLSQFCEETVYFNQNQSLEQYLQVRCTPIYNLENSSKRILLVMNNMTRIKQLEIMRKDFVANVSHELKTPVTLINGYVETLLDGAMNDPEKLSQFLHIINRHSSRINHIIDDLLILSNIEDKGTNIQTEEVGLYDILFSAYTSALDKAENESITMIIHCDESLKLKANPILLEQAVFNLIINAIKYSGNGSKVLINGYEEVRDSKKYAVISIEDNGKGMAEDLLDRIFERFYRINRKQSKKVGGTGLGLSIVKHITLSHRGSVQVTSHPEQGSCFKIILPIL